MRQNEKDKRTYLIIGLCAVLVVMVIGYAAFASNLKINTTSEISSNWCVGFDSTKTSDYVATPGIVGATTPAATMSYSGNTCGANNYTSGASLSASFKQPGDQVVYTFTIKNASSLNAKLDSITENVTTANSAIEYTLSGAEANDFLEPNGTTTLVVTVKYKESVTSQPSTLTWGLELKLNFSQTNAASGGGSSATTFVYGNNGDERCIINSAYAQDDPSCDTHAADGVDDYTELSSYQEGYPWFLKYEINRNNEIQNAWACMKFPFIDEPVCLQGHDGNNELSPYYGTVSTGNRGILEGLVSTFESQNPAGSCSNDGNNFSCEASSLVIFAQPSGAVGAYPTYADDGCFILYNGRMSCSYPE